MKYYKKKIQANGESMASMTTKQVTDIIHVSPLIFSPSRCVRSFSPVAFIAKNHISSFLSSAQVSRKHNLLIPVSKASSSADRILPVDSQKDGVSLGTMKLPSNIDLPRFETLLFQWGNSLCQGANLPLPVPLKVDRVPGGARLGFITIGSNGQPEVLVYIDCLVIPGADNSAPVFRAVRNGPLKEKNPPGEPRIMRGLQDALKKCVELARI